MRSIHVWIFCCRLDWIVLLTALLGFATATPIEASIAPELGAPGRSAQPSTKSVEPTDDFALRLDSQWPKVLVRSFVRVGNRGEEELNVQIPEVCGEPIWVFDHAEIETKRNRFGGVQFVQLPQPGCVADCSPIVVRWYHEPTGHLVFGVRVFRRQTTLECASDMLDEETDT